ncbi:MAG: MOSC domain-containing protein [Pseudomonadota bacterium]
MTQQDKLGTVGGLFRYPVKSLGGEALAAAQIGVSGVAGDRIWAFRDLGRNEISSAKRNPLLLRITAALQDDGHARLSFPSGETSSTAAPDCADRVSDFIGRPQALFGLRPASDVAHFARAGVAVENMEADIRGVLGLLPDETLPDFSKFPAEALRNATVPGTYFDGAVIHIILASELRQIQASVSGAEVDALRFRPNIVLNDLAAPLVSDDLVGATLRAGDSVLRLDYMVPRCSMTTHEQGRLGKAPQIMRTLVRDWKHNFGLYASVQQGGRIKLDDVIARC